MDSIGSAVQVDTRGAEIMRVLPRVNEEVNEEWLSDKGRFSYDGLKKQRLTVPLRRKADGSFEELTWSEALQLAANKLNETSGSEMSAIIGNFADVESIVALKDMLNRFDCDNFEIRSDAPKLDADLRASYLLNSRITGLEDTDFILLVGVNPKYESPVFNARILKAARRGVKIAVVGSAGDYGYEYIHLGNTTKTLAQIAEGKHAICARLSNSKLPMVILGSRTLERTDGEGILNAVKYIANNTPIVNEKEGWNGFNILHHEVGIHDSRDHDLELLILVSLQTPIQTSSPSWSTSWEPTTSGLKTFLKTLSSSTKELTETKEPTSLI
jgi:NADH dehydrogenase (ubiquinone) Fe-S protein 1